MTREVERAVSHTQEPTVPPSLIQFRCNLSGYAKHPAVFHSQPRCSREYTIPTTQHLCWAEICRRTGRNMWLAVLDPNTCSVAYLSSILLYVPLSSKYFKVNQFCLQWTPIPCVTGCAKNVSILLFLGKDWETWSWLAWRREGWAQSDQCL